MRKFDPWPVFFKREWNQNKPFIMGFAIVGAVITKFTAGLTEEHAKNSRFVQEHHSWASGALDLENTASHDIVTSVKSGVWAMIAVFLAYSLLQAPSTCGAVFRGVASIVWEELYFWIGGDD